MRGRIPPPWVEQPAARRDRLPSNADLWCRRFVGGFVATAASLAWVVIRFGPPTGHWSAVVHLVILGLMLPFFGGGALPLPR
jgi:hypothetical protein